MFKRYEHRGHVLLQFIPLRIYKFCLFPQRTFDFKKHEQRRVQPSLFDSRPWLHCDEAKELTLCLSTRELIKESCAAKNLDEAFCILKVTGVLIEKTLMYIFSKIQLFEVQPCADPESYVRGWRGR